MPKLISFERYAVAENNYEGWCVQCQSFTRETTEPDAEDYDCPVCGENCVVGALTALLGEEFRIVEG